MSLSKRRRPWRIVRTSLHRAVVIALVVGTALVVINHGDHLERMPGCPRCLLKCGLSFLVPFMVSMISALLAARGGRDDELSRG